MKTILIVEDESSFLLSLKDGLKAHAKKYEVLTAENGRAAVDLLRESTVDLLVTDLRMPEMNGFELLAWVGRHQPQLPVIVMSAFGTPDIEARLRKMDTLQFIEKPVDLQVLENAIFNGLKAGGKSFIRGITLATFLQLMNVEKKNCTLKVATSEGTAYLFVVNGELIDAEFGSLTGLKAALEVVSWDDAEIEMDGICRRQKDEIAMPLGHLLIEAFRIKDEAAELQNQGGPVARVAVSADSPGGAAEASFPVSVTRKQADSKIVKMLSGMANIQEFALFDELGAIIETNSGPCSIRDFDSSTFEDAILSVTEELSWGKYKSMVLGTTGRNRYLLFQHEQERVLLKLKPGAQAQPVLKELERIAGL